MVRLLIIYFNNFGWNIIFFWVGIIFVGLLVLIVEFFWIEVVLCDIDELFFIYGESLCGLVCFIEDGFFLLM